MKNTLYSIQVLRGIAATLVVIFHSYIHLQARNIIPNLPVLVDSGRAGVDIFFVISGFIMVYISGENFGKVGAARDFFIRRVIRIVPIYWMYTLLMAFFLLTLPHLVSSGKTFNLTHLEASLLFIPWENNVGYIKPTLGVGWTLNFEMYFYAIFAVSLFFSKRYLAPFLAAVMTGGLLAGQLFGPVSPIFYVMTSPLLVEFLAGCIIGALCLRRDVFLPGYLCIMLMLAGVTSLLLTGIVEPRGVPRVVLWGIPAAAIVTGAVFYEKRTKINFHHLLTKLGDSSYSLYLTHIFTINAVGLVWSRVFHALRGGFVVVAIMSSMVAGYFAYLIIERPLTSYLNRQYAARKVRGRETVASP